MMRFDVVRQPLMVAFATLLCIATAAVWFASPYTATGADAYVLLGRYLIEFQNAFPNLARIICTVLIFATGIRLGRNVLRYGLYPIHTYLSIPLYGIIACGILRSEAYTVAYVASYVAFLGLKHLLASFRNGFAFDALFRGGLSIGVLPLIDPALTPLALLVPIATATFKRSTRECTVAIFGLVLPLFAYSYISWISGEPFLATTTLIANTLETQFAPLGAAAIPLPKLIRAGIAIILSIVAIACYGRDQLVIGVKQRAQLLFCSCFWLIALLIAALYATSAATVMPIWALPTAALLPVLFTRIRLWIATPIYLLLLVACICDLIA